MNRLQPKPIVVREAELERLTEVLFPEPEEIDKGGLTMIVDRSVDANLQAALLDLEDGTNDKVTRDTIKKCLDKLYEARELLEARYQITKKAHYLVVDAPDSQGKDPMD
jgi:hypothetical protein